MKLLLFSFNIIPHIACMHSSDSNDGADGTKTDWHEVIIVKLAWENVKWEMVIVPVQ